ncbi:tetratricopeptide repeat protein [Streptomyces sp. URMC 123]|uniref:tetratricopeptide repeat protein n=1 Tax=Streptomyces sp. URMC 123 TaxID=3423403 RepID=UPI003F1A5C73
MAERGVSRRELIRRRRREGFVGRRSELSVFREHMERSPEDEAADFFFHVRGPAGVGKTTLVRRWEAIAGEHGAATAYVGDSVADVVETMEAFSGQLARQGHGFKEFDKALATYRQRRHEAESAALAPAVDGAPAPEAARERPGPSPGSMLASQVGLAGLGLVPGAGPFVGAMDPTQLALGTDRVRTALAARFRNRDDAQLVASPLEVLTPLFVRAVGEAAQRAGRVVLFFDTYERTGTFLDVWLRDVLIEGRYGELPAGVMVVTAGQGRLSPAVWADHLDLVHELELQVFTEAEARQLLATRNIHDEQVIDVILHLSGRLPVLVHLLAESRPAAPEDVGDPSGTAVERFLCWENDPARRAAALACALPLELDEDICRRLTGEEGGAEVFGWLRTRPFVTDQSGRCRYHDVVRDAMVRLRRTQSPQQWQQQHTLLADTYAQRRRHEEQGEERTPRPRWQEQRWRENRLRETYHRLCAHPQRALPAALTETLHAYDHSTAALRRWAQILHRAGHDTDAPAPARYGQDFLDALDSGPDGLISMVTRLLASAGLDSDSRALAHALRGREHRHRADWEAALADYTTALGLAPHLAGAHVGRAWIHTCMGRYEEALAGFAHAIQLEPANADAYLRRGTTCISLQRYDDAVADFTRAIELDPEHVIARNNRGGLYMRMGRYEEAIVDYDRIIALAPRDSLARSSRGRVHARMGRFEEALADHAHAIELDPDSFLVYVNRSETYRYMDRGEEALADLDRVIELRPDYNWAYVNRGETYRRLGRYAEALADFDRAIERTSDSWAKVHRGRLYRLLGRYEDALADVTPPTGWAPTDAWRCYELAMVLRLLQRPGWEEELLRSDALHRGAPQGSFPSPTDASAGLFVVQCARQNWANAEQTLEVLLDSGPAEAHLREALGDMDEAVTVFDLPADPVRALRRRLRQALPA